MFWWCHCQQNTNGREQSMQRGFTCARTGSSTPSHGREVTCRVPQSLHSVCLFSNYSKLNWKEMKNKVMNVTSDSKLSTNCIWLCRVAEGCQVIMRLIIKEQVKFNVDKWKGVSQKCNFSGAVLSAYAATPSCVPGVRWTLKASASGRGNLATGWIKKPFQAQFGGNWRGALNAEIKSFFLW